MIQISNFRKSGKSPNAISIAAITPKWYTGAVRKDLAPKLSILTKYKKGEITMAEYLYEYVHQIYTFDLDKLAKELDGHVLLCYCSRNELCHRLVLAHYLLVETGMEFEEIGGFGEIIGNRDIKKINPPVEVMVKAKGLKDIGISDKEPTNIVGKWKILKEKNRLDLYDFAF